MLKQNPCIAVLGGTGKEGKGLAYRWARIGCRVIVGSRQLEKALSAVAEIKCMNNASNLSIDAMENVAAAQKADIIVLTVPYSAHRDMLLLIKEAVAGKIVIDVTVPLVPPRVTRVQMPPAGSASLEAQDILGESARVVAAFQNISFEKLLTEDDINCDVLVCGQKEAREMVVQLIQRMGLTAWDAGVLENSMVVEGLTSILIGINKQFGIHSAGIKITGVPDKL